MGSELDLHQEYQKPEISLFENGDRFYIRTFLAREPSLSQSSELFYRESEAGIPFKWEAQPGTPKDYVYPQNDFGSVSNAPVPVSPSPLMQSLELRLTDHYETKGSKLNSSKVESFKKMVRKISIASNRGRFQNKQRLSLGKLMESAKDSNVASSSSSSSSSSFFIPWKDRSGLVSSRDSMFDSGSCCRKGNGAGILLQDEEENKGIAKFPRDQEMQPDTVCPRGNDVMEPPRAPVCSSHLPPPRPWTKKALFWIKGSRGRRKTQKFDGEISFRCPENTEINVGDPDEELNMSKSSSSSESFESLKMKGGSYFSCGSWKGMKTDSCVCSKPFNSAVFFR